MAYAILIYYLLVNWENFNCEHPLHTWLLVDYNLLFVIRILYVMKFSGYRHTIVRVINVFFYVFALPGVVSWSILGVIWQAGDAIQCIPEEMVPWSFLLWLGITIMVAATMFVNMVFDLIEFRRLNMYMQRMDESSNAGRTASLIART